MFAKAQRMGGWLAWAAVAALACTALARIELGRIRDVFETDARIAHRLLSQSAVQHDAMLATLVLVQPGVTDPQGADASAAPERLGAIYPQVLQVTRRDGEARWPDAADQAADTLSRATRRPVIAEVDWSRGRYRLLQAGHPSSFAISLDIRQLVPAADWPMPPERHPARVELELEGRRLVLQPGTRSGGLPTLSTLSFSKHLASPSQAFDLMVQREVSWSELPWGSMLGTCLGLGLAALGLAFALRQRAGRARAEELLRLGQMGRLNTMGELAAGLAHELNQPLTAVLASTQAAQRLLKDEPPDLPTAAQALERASAQARRAADVIARLRRLLERPGPEHTRARVRLDDAARDALKLLEPEFRRVECDPRLDGAQGPTVNADPVALSQIVHNLLINAAQALVQVPAAERQLWVTVRTEGRMAVLEVADNGPGFSAEVAKRLFEPFFTTRPDGLGLGLSLCESLARGMGGELLATPRTPRGAILRLLLPLASEAPAEV